MAAQARTRAQARRTDGKTRRAVRYTGGIWLTQRDIDGLILCGEHYAAPYDLLAAALRMRSMHAVHHLVVRWRSTGYAACGRLGPGPA